MHRKWLLSSIMLMLLLSGFYCLYLWFSIAIEGHWGSVTQLASKYQTDFDSSTEGYLLEQVIKDSRRNHKALTVTLPAIFIASITQILSAFMLAILLIRKPHHETP